MILGILLSLLQIPATNARPRPQPAVPHVLPLDSPVDRPYRLAYVGSYPPWSGFATAVYEETSSIVPTTSAAVESQQNEQAETSVALTSIVVSNLLPTSQSLISTLAPAETSSARLVTSDDSTSTTAESETQQVTQGTTTVAATTAEATVVLDTSISTTVILVTSVPIDTVVSVQTTTVETQNPKNGDPASEAQVLTTTWETDYTTVPCVTSSTLEYVVPTYPPLSYSAPIYPPSQYTVPTYPVSPPSSHTSSASSSVSQSHHDTHTHVSAPGSSSSSSHASPPPTDATSSITKTLKHSKHSKSSSAFHKSKGSHVTVVTETSIVQETSTVIEVSTERPSKPARSKTSKSSVPAQQLTLSQEPSQSALVTTSAVATSSSTEVANSPPPVSTGNPQQQISFTAETSSMTVRTTLSTSQVQSPPPPNTITAPGTTGTVITSLERTGNPTIQPFRTAPVSTHSTIKPITTGSRVIKSHSSMRPTAPTGANIFVPIASNAPPVQIPFRGNHPVPREGIVGTEPFQTNKFYGNFYLGTRLESAWTHPYSLSWAGGTGVTGSWGIAVEQLAKNQTFFGPNNTIGAASYFANPLGLQSLILSASELGSSSNMTMSKLEAFSVNINLSPAPGAANILTFPFVQGMGFITGRYNGATPLIQSSIFFKSLTYSGNTFGSGTAKYIVTLLDNTQWLLYATPTSGSVPTLTLQNDTQIIGDKQFQGTIQVGKIPAGTTDQTVFDQSAGVYPVSAVISGTTNRSEGSYEFTWKKAGLTTRTLLMWALPHHIQTFDKTTSKGVTGFQLQTTTKGIATAVVSDTWTMTFDNIPFDMTFNPWSPTLRNVKSLSQTAIDAMNSAGANELAENFAQQTDTDSMYFSGKALAKFAFIVVAMQDLAHNSGLASAGLAKLQNVFATFVNNTQLTPLCYDTSWGGAVTQDGYNNSGADFGNTYYNDHHFHYGYFVYTAAVIGYLNPTWLTEGTNKDWVQMLVRDYANSATDDPYFPFSRMFDWFHGHSWAAGLFESGDGKNEESSSEDTFSAYALKMWGRTIGDPNMEARGNLMLSVQAQSLQDYFLMEDDNTIQPAPFVPNKADGILFENKVDHTTYFGTNIEYIEGIHMLPLNPCSTLIRTPTFVREEWDLYFSKGRVNSIAGGWRGILYANYAIINPTAAYKFFSNPNFNATYLDGGASQTWYLAWSAGLGGAPS